ncbi:MAG: mersacidin/lichenicidin family type 2 lantibiotic [Cyanosarcina radialis HA8281-LM2]|jgi:mersacidin/lichenicidin family type 2 lantibiotic|nr:mersacidin/lichenicidin family type 2 lantibiotic [Cyanosarcina radialis HA8281-LM2]
MSQENIIRAWKDENFRNSLSAEERSLLPAHPAGMLELTDAQLQSVVGGKGAHCYDCTAGIVACTLPIYCGVEQ